MWLHEEGGGFQGNYALRGALSQLLFLERGGSLESAFVTTPSQSHLEEHLPTFLKRKDC